MFDAGIDLRILFEAFVVLVVHKLEAFFYCLFVLVFFGQYPQCECGGAVADEVSVVVVRVGRQGQFGKGGVHGVRDVDEGVEQCAVEVE